MDMNHLLIALFIVLIASVFAATMTWVHSFGMGKCWNKQIVFLDHLFYASCIFACTLVYSDYKFNSDPLDVLSIALVFYIVIWCVPKWGVIK